jgi:SAM-dependent methyltransferase
VAAVHDDFLFAATYLAAAPTTHVVRGAGSAADTRSARQADWIARHLAQRDVANPRVLDVGCFDGALLRELYARCPAALRLAGFDPNPDVAGLFPNEQPFEFHASLASVEGDNHPFDVIIASHSLMYDCHLPETVAILAKLLSRNGLLILIMPDIARNPPYLLMGDQYWFGVPEYLTRMLRQHGIASTLGSVEDWGHDLVLLASATMPPSRLASSDLVTPHMPSILASLDESARRLRSLPSRGPGYHVLGRTANAAFAAAILGGPMHRVRGRGPTAGAIAFVSRSTRHAPGKSVRE